jgi:hypothetical protein
LVIGTGRAATCARISRRADPRICRLRSGTAWAAFSGRNATPCISSRPGRIIDRPERDAHSGIFRARPIHQIAQAAVRAHHPPHIGIFGVAFDLDQRPMRAVTTKLVVAPDQIIGSEKFHGIPCVSVKKAKKRAALLISGKTGGVPRFPVFVLVPWPTSVLTWALGFGATLCVLHLPVMGPSRVPRI